MIVRYHLNRNTRLPIDKIEALPDVSTNYLTKYLRVDSFQKFDSNQLVQFNQFNFYGSGLFCCESRSFNLGPDNLIGDSDNFIGDPDP